jgi:hypothetical protein
MEQSVLTMTSSWLFDAYPLDKNGNTTRLEVVSGVTQYM